MTLCTFDARVCKMFFGGFLAKKGGKMHPIGLLECRENMRKMQKANFWLISKPFHFFFLDPMKFEGCIPFFQPKMMTHFLLSKGKRYSRSGPYRQIPRKLKKNKGEGFPDKNAKNEVEKSDD